jgi:hypothetical protein
MPWRAEGDENCDGKQELQPCREPARAVPAVVVEEFPFTRAEEGKDVLEVRRGARYSAECRRFERAASYSEEEDARETAGDLEPTRAEVLVRNAIARKVENRP